MLSLKNDLLNLQIKFLGSLSSRISINSCSSSSLRIYVIELFVSFLYDIIFISACVPNSSPMIAAAFISITPLIGIS